MIQLIWSKTRWRAVDDRALLSMKPAERRAAREEKRLQRRMGIASVGIGGMTINEDALFVIGIRAAFKREADGTVSGYSAALDAIRAASGGVLNIDPIANRIISAFNTGKKSIDQREEWRDGDYASARKRKKLGLVPVDFNTAMHERLTKRTEEAFRAAFRKAYFRRRSSLAPTDHLDLRIGAVLNGQPVERFVFHSRTNDQHLLALHPKWSLRVREPHVFGEKTLILHVETVRGAPVYHVLVQGRGSSLKVVKGTLARDKRGSAKLLRSR